RLRRSLSQSICEGERPRTDEAEPPAIAFPAGSDAAAAYGKLIAFSLSCSFITLVTTRPQ
ncbi:MAG TPA: hypothetical protein VK651_02665, partial [Blastocatellia bacterium]|nr:hypothetical protein [Blastocatellia bacterium]